MNELSYKAVDFIKEIRSKIQFLVTVQIFFSGVMYAFYDAIGSEVIKDGTNTLFWGIGVAFCLINYLMIGILEESKERMFRWINISISINIACFILPFVILALVVRNPLPSFYNWPFIISFGGAIWMPIVTFSTIIGASYWNIFLWINKLLKNITKK
ncbi:hypothetical protein C4565_04170 [Candidatus Parcubacteria bacterium]|jgi:hypothetical protein|nr:MAG: hypothetical protein C4565_04170 [Candidatus Parcubacteria bacterium]